MSSLETISAGRVLEVRVVGKLTKEAYEAFVPAVDAQIKQYGKLRILSVMQDFHGWTAGALWEDLKFDLKHWKDIERLAIVGDKKWEKGMAAFCKPFTKAEIRYFDLAQLEQAREWLQSESVPAK
jgi:hypothetical protein